MTIALLFWVIMLICLLFGAWSNFPFSGANARSVGFSFIVWVLLALLGWQVFGPALHR
jgi:hypothetical protein